MEKNHIPSLVRKFLEGKCTAEEREVLLDWWKKVLDNDEYLDQLTEAEKEAVKYRMLMSVKSRIKEREKQYGKEGTVKQSSKGRSGTRLYVVAATVLLVAVFLFILLPPISRSNTVSTAYGESREIVLPDGSIVMLNGNSSLTYDPEWTDASERNVWMHGEAYFNVRHTVNNTAFIVHTPEELKIRVLGTKFNVNHRRGITEVVLTEGEVKLEHKEATYVMKPNEMIRYSPQRPQFVPHKVDGEDKTAWKEKMLIFDDEPLAAIANRLEDNYGVKIVFLNKDLENESFSGSIPTDSVTLFLDKIEKLFHAKVKQEGDIYIIE